MRRPLIGITGRTMRFGSIDGIDTRFADPHVHVSFSAFATGVDAAGGIPVHIPFEASAKEVMQRLDGLIVTGGQDVHPARWGGKAHVDPTADPRLDYNAHDRERDCYEANLIDAALASRRAVLAVCRGIQLLNVVRGGTLVEDVHGSSVRHNSPARAPYTGDTDHRVAFAPGSLARTVYGPSRITNSWHHQCLNRLGDGLLATGHAADGVVEVVELSGCPVVGVQWHPEWMPGVDPIFEWLVSASSTAALTSGIEMTP